MDPGIYTTELERLQAENLHLRKVIEADTGYLMKENMRYGDALAAVIAQPNNAVQTAQIALYGRESPRVRVKVRQEN